MISSCVGVDFFLLPAARFLFGLCGSTHFLKHLEQALQGSLLSFLFGLLSQGLTCGLLGNQRRLFVLLYPNILLKVSPSVASNIVSAPAMMLPLCWPHFSAEDLNNSYSESTQAVLICLILFYSTLVDLLAGLRSPSSFEHLLIWWSQTPASRSDCSSQLFSCNSCRRRHSLELRICRDQAESPSMLSVSELGNRSPAIVSHLQLS